MYLKHTEIEPVIFSIVLKYILVSNVNYKYEIRE